MKNFTIFGFIFFILFACSPPQEHLYEKLQAGNVLSAEQLHALQQIDFSSKQEGIQSLAWHIIENEGAAFCLTVMKNGFDVLSYKQEGKSVFYYLDKKNDTSLLEESLQYFDKAVLIESNRISDVEILLKNANSRLSFSSAELRASKSTEMIGLLDSAGYALDTGFALSYEDFAAYPVIKEYASAVLNIKSAADFTDHYYVEPLLNKKKLHLNKVEDLLVLIHQHADKLTGHIRNMPLTDIKLLVDRLLVSGAVITNTEFIQLLFDSGLPVDYRIPLFETTEGLNLLSAPIRKRDRAVITYLLEKGVSVLGNDIYQLYIQEGMSAVLTLPEYGIDLDTPIKTAFGDGMFGASNEFTLAAYLISENKVDDLKALVESGISLDFIIHNESFRLDIATKYKTSYNYSAIAYLKALETNDFSIYTLLMDKGAKELECIHSNLPDVQDDYSVLIGDEFAALNEMISQKYMQVEFYIEKGIPMVTVETYSLLSYLKKYNPGHTSESFLKQKGAAELHNTSSMLYADYLKTVEKGIPSKIVVWQVY